LVAQATCSCRVSILEASGDLIHTGLTGTNVMDLVIALKLEIG